MSIKLMSLVWDIEWPTQSQLVIALKLADYANDDGEKIFPARETLAQKAHCSETTVKAALKAFRGCGLLHVVHDGGKGPKDTTVYRLNVALLAALADGRVTISGCSDALEIDGDFPEVADANAADEKGSAKGAEKGSKTDPLAFVRGQSDELRGQPAPEKGVNGRPQSTKESPNRLISAPERASDEGARAPGAKKPASRTLINLTPIDVQWVAWIEHLEQLGREDLSLAAQRAGTMAVVGSKWPKGEALPIISEAAIGSISVDRMQGGQS